MNITELFSSILEQKEKLENAIANITTNSDSIKDLVAKVEDVISNEGGVRSIIDDLLAKTDSIKSEVEEKLKESKDSMEGSFDMIKDTISNIETTLVENNADTKTKLEKIFKDLVSINEKIVLKENYDKDISKINKTLASLAEEDKSMSEFLEQTNKDLVDIREETIALHHKNIEQDKQIQDLKKATAANKELISNNTINIREDIDELKTSHIEQINALSAELKKLKDEGKDNKSDDATTRSVVERLSDIIDGLLIEDEKVNSRITFVLNELNTKITKLNKRWVAAFVPITICLFALGIVALMF